ncbi:MAG: EamA family transporter [Acidobacteria bacterium]|jgi:drug/metabolite transporter (DMT)-like permease|nr:EamA family transporter [Acidobacteriota bacterium]
MRARIVWLLLCAIWGSTWLFIKLGLRDLPPISFAGIRFVIASLILLAIVFIRRRPIPRAPGDWALIAATGVLAFAINYGLLFWGEQYISSGLAALLQTTIPAFGLLIAHLHLPQERLTLVKVCGVVLGIAGVGVIFSNQLSVEGPLALWGSAAIVTGAFCAAYSNVLIKARGGHLDPALMAAGQMICGLVPLLIVGILTEGNPLLFHWTPLAIFSLLYLVVVGSVVAFMLYYWLVRNMDVTKTMLIALVTPLIAVILGMIVLDERLSWRTVLGGACIMSGIGLIVLRRIKERALGGVTPIPHAGSDSV